MPVLSSKDIRRLIKRSPPLIEGWLDLDEQVQTNGFDLTLRDIAKVASGGTIAAANSQRVLSALAPLPFGDGDFSDLPAGIYVITYNEIVHLPKSIMALGRPRSSLLRCGVNVGTAVWDAGYEGRSQSLLMVLNPQGFRVQQNARLTQLVFMDLTGESEGYKGIYQGENI
ncbi:MAG: deoxyuridine 5'-triphosphate nucleotidohydrolase [Dehalococcoidales bacterium]|jgi:dUTP pyrophosphatase